MIGSAYTRGPEHRAVGRMGDPAATPASGTPASADPLADPKPADAKEPEADDPMKAMLEEAEKDAKKKKP